MSRANLCNNEGSYNNNSNETNRNNQTNSENKSTNDNSYHVTNDDNNIHSDMIISILYLILLLVPLVRGADVVDTKQ